MDDLPKAPDSVHQVLGAFLKSAHSFADAELISRNLRKVVEKTSAPVTTATTTAKTHLTRKVKHTSQPNKKAVAQSIGKAW